MRNNKIIVTQEMVFKMKDLILSTNLDRRQIAKEMGFAYSTAQRLCMDSAEFKELWRGFKYYRITRDMGINHSEVIE